MSFLFNKNELTDSKGRSYYLDNAKFVLIFFVVLAHSMSEFKTSSAACNALWYLLNTFHMPAFIFISGYLAKSFLKKPLSGQAQRVGTYFILYAAAQVSVAAFEKLVIKDDFSFSFFYSRSSLWFLGCLVAWHLVLPFVGKFKPSFIIPAAVLFSLYIGYDSQVGHLANLSRIIVHFPFFLAGYYISPKFFDFIKRAWVKVLSAFVIAGTFAVYYILSFYKVKIPGNIITCNYRYSKCGFPTAKPTWWLWRLGFYIVAALLTVAFLSLTPKFKTCYSKLGSRTLSVYILHRFLYLAYLEYDWAKPFVKMGSKGALLMTLIVAVITVILSTWLFNYPFELLQKIKIKKLLIEDKPEKA